MKFGDGLAIIVASVAITLLAVMYLVGHGMMCGQTQFGHDGSPVVCVVTQVRPKP